MGLATCLDSVATVNGGLQAHVEEDYLVAVCSGGAGGGGGSWAVCKLKLKYRCK